MNLMFWVPPIIYPEKKFTSLSFQKIVKEIVIECITLRRDKDEY